MMTETCEVICPIGAGICLMRHISEDGKSIYNAGVVIYPDEEEQQPVLIITQISDRDPVFAACSAASLVSMLMADVENEVDVYCSNSNEVIDTILLSEVDISEVVRRRTNKLQYETELIAKPHTIH